MKKLFFISFLFATLFYNQSVFAKNLSNEETDSTEIILKKGDPSGTDKKRMPPHQLPIKAYLYGSTLAINFYTSNIQSTITIKDNFTGETIYSENNNDVNPVIDLSPFLFTNNSKEYELIIETSSIKVSGQFNI